MVVYLHVVINSYLKHVAAILLKLLNNSMQSYAKENMLLTKESTENTSKYNVIMYIIFLKYKYSFNYCFSIILLAGVVLYYRVCSFKRFLR